METLTISPKFRVPVPRRIREQLRLTPGQRIQARVYRDRIELIPLQPAKHLRGFLAGIDTTVPRESDRS